MRAKNLFIFMLGMLFLYGCGDFSTDAKNTDDSVTNQTSDTESTAAKLLASAADLPDCDEDALGLLFYILDDEEFQVCTADGFRVIDLTGPAGAPGVDGADGIGGTNGEDGADGNSCDVTDNGDGTYTLACENGNTVILRDGADGADGSGTGDQPSIEWLGVLTEKPANPTTNQAFYWFGKKISCIYTGEEWEVLSADGGVSITTCNDHPYEHIAFTDPRDGQEYNSVQIGNQVWMAENLNYSGDDGAGNKTFEIGWCFGEGGTNTTNHAESTTCDTYGRLYTWYMVMDGAASSDSAGPGPQGICPAGWHVPSDGEWTELTDYVIANTESVSINEIDRWLKAADAWSESHVFDPTDDFGFSALPGGFRSHSDGSFYYQGDLGLWWSATEYNSDSAWDRDMYYYNENVYRNNNVKGNGYSLRCVQD